VRVRGRIAHVGRQEALRSRLRIAPPLFAAMRVALPSFVVLAWRRDAN
jgi:hypothetical protein